MWAKVKIFSHASVINRKFAKVCWLAYMFNDGFLRFQGINKTAYKKPRASRGFSLLLRIDLTACVAI
jgi:hypothetical protein